MNIESCVEVITIDGPGGVGKSTVAQMLARELGCRHLDTGAMYRVISLAVMEQDVPDADIEEMARLARTISIEMIETDGGTKILCDGRDVTRDIRTPEVSRKTSLVADVIGVRQEMVAHQRRIGLEKPCVAEGRDMGTVVFPDAVIRFFLEGSLEERVRRRHNELIERGNPRSIDEVREDIERRDFRDRTRPYGALRIADGAVVLDTTHLNAREVVTLMGEIARQSSRL